MSNERGLFTNYNYQLNELIKFKLHACLMHCFLIKFVFPFWSLEL